MKKEWETGGGASARSEMAELKRRRRRGSRMG
jgi:hypothetical protein